MAEKEEFASTEDVMNENSCDSSKKGQEEIFAFGFDIKSEKSDLVLTVEKRPLYVKRADLEYVSPVFESLFESKLKGQTTNELTVDGENYKDFVEFLACIQSRAKRKVSKENVFRMLALADKYRVEELKDLCENYLGVMLLKSKPLEAEFILKVINCAYVFDLDELKKLCQEKVSNLSIDIIGDKEAMATVCGEAKNILYEEFLPSLLSKSHLADFMMTNIPKEQKGCMQRFSNAKKVQITYKTSTKTVCHRFRRWDIDWEIEVEFHAQWHIPSKIKMNYKSMMQFTCQVGLAYILVNHIPWKDHRPMWKFWDIDSSQKACVFSNVLSGQNVDEIMNGSSGFNNNGIYTIDIHVLVNKPVFK